MTRPLALWIAFLVLWSGSLVWTGAVSVWAVPVTAAAFSALYLVSLVLLPEKTRLSKPAVIFLLALAGLFLLQLLPVAPLLFPHTARLRAAHGVGAFWPATADTFYTVRTLAQVSTYVVAALLVIRLRQAGLRTSSILVGVSVVLMLEAAYGIVQTLSRFENIPFYGPRPAPDSASGSLVNRDSFGGLMALAIVLVAVQAYGRFAFSTAAGEERGRTPWANRLEGGIGWALAAGLFAVALVMSRSRGAVLAAAGGMLLLPLMFRGRASLVGAAVLSLLAALAAFIANPAGLFQRFSYIDPYDLTVDKRWTIFTSTFRAALHQPIFGFGWGTHPLAYHPFQPPSLAGQIHHAHNEYLNVFFEAGIAGLLLLLAGMGFWLVRVWRAQKLLSGPDRPPAIAALGATGVILLHALVDFDLRITSIGILWASLLGLGSTVVRDGVSRATWPAPVVALLASAVLVFLPVDRPLKADESLARAALGPSPYDHRWSWMLAKATGDPTRIEIAADLWPAHPDLQHDAGLEFWERGDRPRAAKFLKRLFEQNPGSVEQVMDELGDDALQVDQFEPLLPPTTAARTNYAAALARRGLWQLGMEAFNRGAGNHPDDAVWYDQFAAQLHKAGQWGLEATVRDRRLQLRSDAWAYAASARAWFRLGATDLALERARTASRIDLISAEWPALCGEILAAKGERTAAIESYSEACARAPAEIDWKLQRALLLLEDRTFAAAAGEFREVLRSRPTERRAVLGLSRALAGQSQTSTARMLLDDWLRNHPTDTEAAELRTTLKDR